MKKLLLATVASAAMATAVSADDVKIGVFLGFTGPIESLVAQMGPGAEAAIAEVSASGSFMNGSTVTAIRADTTCVDAGAATAAAERLITSDKVSGIVGGGYRGCRDDCSCNYSNFDKCCYAKWNGNDITFSDITSSFNN